MISKPGFVQGVFTPVRSLALALLVLAGCGPQTPAPPQAPGPSISGQTVRFSARVDGLRVEAVRPAGSPALALPGRLSWDEDRTVRVLAPVGGRVLRPLVNLGDRVAAGQPLAEIASAEYGSALAEARLALSQAQLAEETVRRQTELFDAGLVARRDLLQAQAERDQRTIEQARTQTRLRQLGDGQGPNFLLRAPIAGVVVDRRINPGQEIKGEGGADPLFTLTDPSRLWVRIDATEADLAALGGVGNGTPVKLVSMAYPGREFEGVLTSMGAAVDPDSRTLVLRGRVPNPEGLLKAEMYVRVRFPLGPGHREGLLHDVPSSAVLLNAGEHYVFVLDATGGYTRTPVKVERIEAGRSLIQGLAAGQKVVVEGVQFLEQILSTSPAVSTPDRGKP